MERASESQLALERSPVEARALGDDIDGEPRVVASQGEMGGAQ